jgi:hypothetical protein
MHDLKFSSILYNLIRKLYVNQISFIPDVTRSTKDSVIKEYQHSIKLLNDDTDNDILIFRQQDIIELIEDLQKQLEERYAMTPQEIDEAMNNIFK